MEVCDACVKQGKASPMHRRMKIEPGIVLSAKIGSQSNFALCRDHTTKLSRMLKGGEMNGKS